MSFLERQTTRITGTNRQHDDRRKSFTGRKSTGNVPNAKKPRSRPPTSFRDHLPFPNSSLPPASGPYSVGSMEIEVPVEDPHTISHITRNGMHLLQLETVLFTLYYPAAFGSGAGEAPGGQKKWSRETWLPRPRLETAKGYAKFAGIPDWAGIGFFGATSMLTKLRAYRNTPPARHWPPEGNSKKHGSKVKNEQGMPPEGIDREPTFPLLMFSHGLGGSRTAYSSLCTEFASYGFVVCAVEHRDGSGPRTFVNHPRQVQPKQETHSSVDVAAHSDTTTRIIGEKKGHSCPLDHTEEELRQGFHHVDYIFPKGNPKDTAPNNEQGVDRELRNAQIEMRLCELEEAYRVLKVICVGNGTEIERQNLRCEGCAGGSSKGLKGVDWQHWKNRFHIEKMTMAGHSFGAATVVEVLRHTDRFKNVQAGIIYDIWGAPIAPPAEDPQHRIHLPLLGINSEAFMYWQSNFDAVMSLMKEASEYGAPAYLITVRGSVHISQSDFSVLYKHIVSFFMKATVHPNRAIDLNTSASLEFLKLVTPDTGGGKTIIDRCMADEELLHTDLLENVPNDNRPDDEYIAARLRVNHEFRRRMAAGLQRKFKRNFQGGMGTGYTTADEIWNHFKPSDEALKRWIVQEDKGEKRIDEQSAMEGSRQRASLGTMLENSPNKTSQGGHDTTIPNAIEREECCNEVQFHGEQKDERSKEKKPGNQLSDELESDGNRKVKNGGPPDASADAAGMEQGSGGPPRNTWLGMVPALRDGPQQSKV